ncbi:nitroreductase family protein [Neobacillus drentensis]|uniref:nitroreductase family protein n=1 Tax=Neobacillus drentensis TaxID=220684 RepID=UPI002FFF68AD
MIYKKSVTETIRKRQSIRTYENQAISAVHLQQIHDYINDSGHLKGPFGQTGRIVLVEVKKNVTDKGIKLGTYGFIKNPSGYLVGITENNREALIDFAFTFQKLVLFLTELEIGTCWMGGTFSRNSFEEEIQLDESGFIPCITPIGYPKQKQRVFDKAVRLVVKADNKKPWDKLFYDTDFESNLTKENAGLLEVPVEMVRLGPSASNKQPWRLVVSEDRKICHFYIEHTPNYSTKLGYDMQLLDMGIALCQFESACQELNISGNWAVSDPEITPLSKQTEYIVSWHLDS